MFICIGCATVGIRQPPLLVDYNDQQLTEHHFLTPYLMKNLMALQWLNINIENKQTMCGPMSPSLTRLTPSALVMPPVMIMCWRSS